MVQLSNYWIAIMFCIFAMICWGSWQNTQYHGSSVAIIIDGKIIAAQEERFTRQIHVASFTHHRVKYVLKEAGISIQDILTFFN